MKYLFLLIWFVHCNEGCLAQTIIPDFYNEDYIRISSFIANRNEELRNYYQKNNIKQQSTVDIDLNNNDSNSPQLSNIKEFASSGILIKEFDFENDRTYYHFNDTLNFNVKSGVFNKDSLLENSYEIVFDTCHRIVKTIRTFNNENLKYTEEEYKYKQQVLSRIFHFDKNGNHLSTTHFKYNRNKLIKKKTIKSGLITKGYIEKTKYNKLNKIVYTKRIFFSNMIKRVWESTKYNYHDNGKIDDISIIRHYIKHASTGVFNEIRNYHYDSLGRILTFQLIQKKDSIYNSTTFYYENKLKKIVNSIEDKIELYEFYDSAIVYKMNFQNIYKRISPISGVNHLKGFITLTSNTPGEIRVITRFNNSNKLESINYFDFNGSNILTIKYFYNSNNLLEKEEYTNASKSLFWIRNYTYDFYK